MTSPLLTGENRRRRVLRELFASAAPLDLVSGYTYF